MITNLDIITYLAEKFVLSRLGDVLKVQNTFYHPDGFWIIDVAGRKARWIKKRGKKEAVVFQEFPNIASFKMREIRTKNCYGFEFFDVPDRKKIAEELVRRIKEAR